MFVNGLILSCRFKVIASESKRVQLCHRRLNIRGWIRAEFSRDWVSQSREEIYWPFLHTASSPTVLWSQLSGRITSKRTVSAETITCLKNKTLLIFISVALNDTDTFLCLEL